MQSKMPSFCRSCDNLVFLLPRLYVADSVCRGVVWSSYRNCRSAVLQLRYARIPIAIRPYSNWCTVSKCCRKPSFLRSLEDVPIMTHPLDSNCQMRIMHRLHFLIHTLSGVKVCFVQFFCFHGVMPMYKIVALFSGIAIY